MKTACANYNKGGWSKSWFNQVRPQESGWDWLYLVDVHPEFVRILRLNRYDGGLDELSTGHVTGADDSSQPLLQVTLLEKPKRRLDSVDSWEIVWDSREVIIEAECG